MSNNRQCFSNQASTNPQIIKRLEAKVNSTKAPIELHNCNNNNDNEHHQHNNHQHEPSSPALESHELKPLATAHEADQLEVATAVMGELPQSQLVQRPSFRSRNRPTISWGPPPIAPYNVTQLPFKIDETTPSSSPSTTAAPLASGEQATSHEL